MTTAKSHLLRWAAGETPRDSTTGICFNLLDLTQDFSLYKKIRIIAKEWPEYSGNDEYPVPHDTLPPEEVYLRPENLWVGNYGAARCRLCAWLAEQPEIADLEAYE